MCNCSCGSEEKKNALLPQVGIITDIRRETPDVKTFRIVRPDGTKLFEHMPGQCAMLCVPGVGEALFSITSSPTNKEYQEFSIKECGTLTNYLHNMSVGDEILVRGPYGNHFPVETVLKGQDLLFIAGGIINLSEWWGILLAAYGCYLTTSTYSSANHTAHKLAEQIKKSGMPFPASRYEFRENHLEVYSLPKNTRESTLAYNEFEKLGEDRDYFYLFRDSYGGYMVPKKGIDASAGSRSNSDESQNLKAIGAFRDFLENKSGKRIYRKTIPLVRVMQALKKKR